MLDVVVIGAGAAGIAAARRFSELRLSYALVEAKPFAGGRARTDNVTLGPTACSINDALIAGH